MKTLLLLLPIFFCVAKASALPSIICDYGKSQSGWALMGAAVTYVDGTPQTRTLGSTSTNETYGPLVGTLSGVCVSPPVNIDGHFLLKMATYTSPEDFEMDDNTCEFIPNGASHQTLAHFTLEPVQGTASKMGTDILNLITYFPTPAEIKAWSQSADQAQAAATKKCLQLFQETE